ncbi:MAG TPA: methyltransferase [Kineosporiaceae bacterium]|nr:methyltransferase [Kineosporiaceae bacterium]
MARRPPPQPPQDAAAAAVRVIDTVLAAADLAAIVLGDRTGWYAALADGRPRTAPDLAAATATSARYALEWCEQQAATGLLEVVAEGEPADQRLYRLPAGLAAVLAEPDSPAGLAPLVRQMAAAVGGLPRLEQAYRDGTGVGWSEHGPAMLSVQAETNRAAFAHLLPGWFAAIPDVHARLQAAGSRIADIGCGLAWSSIALARAYPQASVDAVDIEPQTVVLARQNVIEAGLDGRIAVHRVDAAGAAGAGLRPGYDLVTAFECIHDLPDPVAVLASMRGLAAGSGTVVIADEAVGERFRAPAGRLERLMYGFSLLICLPDSMCTPGSAAIGTVMRPDTLRALAAQAGFDQVDVLPIEHDSWRFYRLRVTPPAAVPGTR